MRYADRFNLVGRKGSFLIAADGIKSAPSLTRFKTAR